MLSTIDWIVLAGTLALIVLYGVYRTRGEKSADGYITGGKDARWWTVGLSIMATQASAITFLSTPGQAYTDGMGFVQIYFGLPFAIIVICAVFIPIYYRLKVYTAYEYLESRFDLKTRILAATYFLIQRGMGAGITIYAPAIILSTILGWNLNYTIIVIGILVIIYTVSGGTKAVNQTQKLQMAVILVGMTVAFVLLIRYLPTGMGLRDALHVAGASGKMEIVDLSFDPSSRYNIWSGILGAFFLSLAYFGTDQSQVQRYLTASSIKESRLGLMFNALLKVPMQFFILLTGVLVFIFYQYHKPPVFFNPTTLENIRSASPEALGEIEDAYDDWFVEKQSLNDEYLTALRKDDDAEAARIADAIRVKNVEETEIRDSVRALISTVRPAAETNDRDYIFINFILDHLPIGIIGLLLAVIFSAAMSSTAAELNALGSTTTVDIYKRNIMPEATEQHYLFASRSLTMVWGIIAISFALVASLFENLIQFVNIVGSLFYGTMLGFFVVAFAFKHIRNGTVVFISAVIAELMVLGLFFYSDIGFLWYNLIGCAGVVILALILNETLPKRQKGGDAQ